MARRSLEQAVIRLLFNLVESQTGVPRLLVERVCSGLDVNTCFFAGRTLLDVAVWNDRVPTARFLLFQAGARPRNGKEMVVAINHGCTLIADSLARRGSDLVCASGRDAFHYASPSSVFADPGPDRARLRRTVFANSVIQIYRRALELLRRADNPVAAGLDTHNTLALVFEATFPSRIDLDRHISRMPRAQRAAYGRLCFDDANKRVQ